MTSPMYVDAATPVSAAFVRTANRLPTLYQLSDDAQALMALQDVPDDELEGLGLTREGLAQREEELAAALLQKVESYGVVMRELHRLGEARRGEAQRMAARARAMEDAFKRMNARLTAHMQDTGQRRIETAKFTFRLQPNPKSVTVLDEHAVPGEFKTVTVNIRKDDIARSIRATGVIPDGVEWASSGDSLRVS